MGQTVGPATPSGLTAEPGASAGQVALSWAAMPGAQTYTLQRSTSANAGFVTIGSVATPALTYTDSDPALQADLTYYYKIAATGAQGTSAYGTPVAGTPNTPANITGWPYRNFGSAGLAPTMANGVTDEANPPGMESSTFSSVPWDSTRPRATMPPA